MQTAAQSGDQSLMDQVVLAHRKKAAKAQKEVEEFLISNGFDPSKPNEKRGSWWVTYPIHEAVKQNDFHICALLLALGANPNKRDTWGRTAYHFAKSQSHQTVMNVLLQHKAAFEAHAAMLSESQGTSNTLRSSPPPRGFEEFFANISEYPEVVRNCEAAWLEIRWRFKDYI